MFKKYGQILFFLLPALLQAQEVELFQQFNGRYDYLSFGNTLNLAENSGGDPPAACEILTESSADFQLQAGQQLIAAYLYWGGSGTGDLEVNFGGNSITAERTFDLLITLPSGNEFNYFAAFTDVTDIVSASGNGNYTLADLDLTQVIPPYCSTNNGNASNYGGWAVTVIYEDPSLPLNQVNIFDGLEAVWFLNTSLTITLDNLNVLDNSGAKLGFLAWEGDVSAAVNETLRINGNVISNPPLNPEDNLFNGTNSFTGSSELYNMDIDFFNIENNINPGDTSATIQLTSNVDLVLINNIITVINTELPDATITIEAVTGATTCGDRDITIDYVVLNENSTAALPAGTRIGFYAQNILLDTALTQTVLPIGASESGTINLTIPDNIPADFLLRAIVDDDQMIAETNEENNEDNTEFHLLVFPEITGLEDLELCDLAGIEQFDLTGATDQIDPINTINYHLTEVDAINGANPVVDPENYENISNPQTIWIRVANPDCFVVDSFDIEVIICPFPDATITIDEEVFACRQRDLIIQFTVYNRKGLGPLPAPTPIAFYVDGVLIGQAETQNVISEGESEIGNLETTLSDAVPDSFTIRAVVDDDGTGIGIVEELDETNNEFEIMAEFGTIAPIPTLPDLLECDLGFDTAFFDLTEQNELISTDPNDQISYFTTLENAIANENAISDPEQYENAVDPQLIFVRLENEICFTKASFLLTTENCKPVIAQGISPNNDTLNDDFIITGLIDVFVDFNLRIYSREGNLIYEGGNDDGFWDGIPNTGLLFQNKVVPVGTYYYALILNDPEFPDALLGYIYVNY